MFNLNNASTPLNNSKQVDIPLKSVSCVSNNHADDKPQKINVKILSFTKFSLDQSQKY